MAIWKRGAYLFGAPLQRQIPSPGFQRGAFHDPAADLRHRGSKACAKPIAGNPHHVAQGGAAEGHRPIKVRRGSILRPARPQRRGQVDHHQHPGGRRDLATRPPACVKIWRLARTSTSRRATPAAAIGVVPQGAGGGGRVLLHPQGGAGGAGRLLRRAEEGAAHRRPAGRHGPDRQGQGLCAAAVGRHEAAADGGQGHGARPAGADPRRAHRGGGRGASPPALGVCGRPQPAGRHHRPDHPLSGGGRAALRHHRHRQPRRGAAAWRARPERRCCARSTPARR